jgi:hypothetical protein
MAFVVDCPKSRDEMLFEWVEVARHGPGPYRVNHRREPPPEGSVAPPKASMMVRKPVNVRVAVRAAAPAAPAGFFFARLAAVSAAR